MQIIIVGNGKVGLAITQMLAAENHNLTVVDENPRVLTRLQEEYDVIALEGHGATRHVLQEAGAAEADLLIAVTSLDEINLLCCLTAKKLGCRNTIARVRNPEYADDVEFLREDLGLSFAINPEEACAQEIFDLLQFPSFLERDQFAKGRAEIVCIKVAAASPLCGLPLSGLAQKAKVHALVCAAQRGEELIIPHGNFVMQENDLLYLAARGARLATLLKNLGYVSQKVTQVTIVGGSRIGLYLAAKLLKIGVGVKLIEKNTDRCLRLAEILPDADIVEADGTSQEVLQAEGIARSDALVALTDIDEENIVLSIYARQLGVAKVITKCNREKYAEMFRPMGVDTVVSPKATSAEKVVHYVRAMENSSGGQMKAMHHIAGGKAEAMEFRATASARMLNTPLASLSLKKGLLIAAILRGGETIIPKGDSVIRRGDSVIVVTAKTRILDLNDILAEE